MHQRCNGYAGICFYDTDYLEIDTDSINFDNLNGVIYNGNLDGYMTFNFSDISNYASFSSRTQLVSMNFKVKNPEILMLHILLKKCMTAI